MGTWGTAIFANDVTSDVRDTYIEKLCMGLSDIEAEAQTIQEFATDFEEESYLLWLALSITEWKNGRLSEHVMRQGLKAIDFELANLTEIWPKSQQKKREEVLHTTQTQLLSPPPPRKKIRLPSWANKVVWSPGNVLQYRIADGAEREVEFIGKYVLLQVVAISETPSGKIPCEYILVGLYDWISEFPPVIDNLNELKLSGFTSITGIVKPTLSVLLTSSDIKRHNVQCVSQNPLFNKPLSTVYDVNQPIPAPCGIDYWICNTFLQS